MKKRIQLLILGIITGAATVFAQMPKATTGTFALTNGTVETITKGTINNGTVVITNGKITAVGTNIQVPAAAQVINCNGLKIYPGFIDGGSVIGLLEIGQIPQATDVRETGQIIPQMRALSAINPSAAGIPVTRVSGVTTVITNPDGGLMPGTSALIQLHGYTPDQMYAGFEGIVINWPNTGRRGFFDRRTDDEIKKASDKSLKQLDEAWEKAVAYHKLDSATNGKGATYYPEMQALMPAVRGQMAVMIEANTSKDITSALKWVKDKKVQKAILTGVSEGWRVAEDIAKAKIPVITGPIIAMPTREYDRYDQAYANAGMLKKAGVTVAIRSNESQNVRNLPYHAGFAVAYGMNKEDALKAITIVPAEIFGVSDKLGSIEVGKSGTLFICDGDPFETKTQIKEVFIDGWKMPMTNRHVQLYEEYLKREPGVSKN